MPYVAALAGLLAHAMAIATAMRNAATNHGRINNAVKAPPSAGMNTFKCIW